MAVRALLFDVFGTLVDWRGSLIDLAVGLDGDGNGGVDWAAVVDDWRRAYQPAMDRLVLEREGAGRPWRDLDELQRETLDAVLVRHGLALPESQRRALVRGWRQLLPWPDTREGLEALRGRFVTATLSNGHVGLLVDLLRFGDLAVDAVLSAQLADSYKPQPSVYLRALELLECAPHEAMLVACHARDLRAAAQLGLGVVFVRRPREWGDAGGDEPPSELPGLLVVDALTELARVPG